MKQGTVAVIMAVVIVLAFVAGLGSSPFLLRGGKASMASGSSASTTCVISAEGEVVLQVLNSTSGRPVASASVQAQFLALACPPNPHTTTTLNATVTNSTGFVVFGGVVGQYSLSVDGYAYPLVVSALPERTTCVTLSLPSGETHIAYSATFQFRC